MPVTNEQLSSMVEEYCSHRPDWERQIAFYTNIEDFAELLDKAGRAVEENERKCKHQRRQQRDDLLACSERLLARQSEFEQAENFEQIHPGPPHSECIADKRHKWMFAPAANLLFTIRLCPSPT